jgi:hypothetical protein
MPPGARGRPVPDLSPYFGTAAVHANLEVFRSALSKPGARLSDVARDVGVGTIPGYEVDPSFFTYLDNWPAPQAQKLLDLLRAEIIESSQPRGLAIGWIDADDGSDRPPTMENLEVIIGDWAGDPIPVIIRSPHP